MAVDDAFRVAFRTGGKEDNRVIFRLLFNLCQMGHQQVSENPQLVARRHVRLQIFQEDPANLSQLLRQMPQLAFIQELARGKNGVDLGRSDGTGQPFYTRRVVHHCRNTAAGHRTKNHRCADARVRQHQANLFTLLTVFFKNAAHKQGLGQQFAICVRREIDVFNTVFPGTIAILCRKQRFIQRFARTNGHSRFHHNLVQHFSGNFTAIAGTRCIGHR